MFDPELPFALVVFAPCDAPPPEGVWRLSGVASATYHQSREAALACAPTGGTPFTVVDISLRPWCKPFAMNDALVLRMRRVDADARAAALATLSQRRRNGHTLEHPWDAAGRGLLTATAAVRVTAEFGGHGGLSAIVAAAVAAGPSGHGVLSATAHAKYPYGQSTCTVAGCGRPHHCRGLCQGHYRRWVRTGQVSDGPPRRYGDQGCTILRCEREHHGDGFCGAHLKRAYGQS
jgi:hypothetical protein